MVVTDQLPLPGPENPSEEILRTLAFEEPGGCWIWTGYCNGGGYGIINRAGWSSPRRAHRVAYEVFRGPIPEGQDLDHLCHNRACINPYHLEPVSRQVNLLRGKAHKRWLAERGELRCDQGHQKEVFPDGAVRCRECRNARRRVRR